MPREHRVCQGDTYHRLSRIYGVTINSLEIANPELRPGEGLPLGHSINIPGEWDEGAPQRLIHNHLWNAIYPSGVDPYIKRRMPVDSGSGGPVKVPPSSKSERPPPPAKAAPPASDTQGMSQDQQADTLTAASNEGKPLCAL